MKLSKLIILFILIIFLQNNTICSAENLFNTNRLNSILKKALPNTFDEAVEYIIDSLNNEDKLYIKNYPKHRLIMFHHGWGTGIRNKILRGNDFLMNSCAIKAGVPSIYYDEASMLLIHGVWEELNRELNLTDFKTISPIIYFKEIEKTLLKAKTNNEPGYLASLPEWIFNSRGHHFNSEIKKARDRQLLEVAKELANEEITSSYLGILYLVYNSDDLTGIEHLLKNKLNGNSEFIELPTYYDSKTNNIGLFIKQITTKKIADKIIEYSWIKLTTKAFLANCYGSLHRKNFKSFEDYKAWNELEHKNYLIKWKRKREIPVSALENLMNEPEKLLNILILTKQYASFDIHNHGLTRSFYRESRKTAENTISLLGFKDSLLTKYPYHPHFKIRGTSSNQLLTYQFTHALTAIANKLKIEEVLDILSPSKIIYYNKNLKTEDLAEYKLLGGFLLATQYKRLLNVPNKEKIFGICYNYWKNEFITWPMKYYITDLLFQIDSNKASNIFLEYFKETPTKGSFTRHAILKSIVKHQFVEKKDFIESWYWKVHNKDFNHRPIESELILSLLKETNNETLKLFYKIKKDEKFIK